MLIGLAVQLATKGTIPQVRAQADIIAKVQTTVFWQEHSLFDCEEVRVALRDLINFLEGDGRKYWLIDTVDYVK